MPKPPKSAARFLHGIVILHEDHNILVVDKPAGLLTIGTDKERERTAYFILTEYVRKGNARSRNRIFIVHRLDRETSGVLVLAKTEAAKFRLQSQWETTEKIYLAVANGHMAKESGLIESYLAESKALMVYSTADRAQGRLARTEYRVLKQTKDRALLELKLLTGRKNQIRVHLADLGHPIVGDRKYGPPRQSASARLALHARSILFNHPATGKPLSFKAPIPAHFGALLGGIGLEPLA